MTDDDTTEEIRALYRELFDTIEHGDWRITDIDGMVVDHYETPSVTVSVEYVPPETAEVDVAEDRSNVETVLAIVKELEAERGGIANHEEVLDFAEADGLSRDAAEHAIDVLRQRGEVYEPTEHGLRAT